MVPVLITCIIFFFVVLSSQGQFNPHLISIQKRTKSFHVLGLVSLGPPGSQVKRQPHSGGGTREGRVLPPEDTSFANLNLQT